MGVELESIVIGIDGGGTHTRVMVSDLSGNVLAYIERGAASLHKDLQAKQNVNHAILEALSVAGKELRHVRGIAAGIAGFDSESDLEWVESLTEINGLSCPKWHINDAVVAQYGALMGKPGIVAISGTGSIILGITEEGQFIRNYDYHHYAASAARFLAYDATYEILAGNSNDSDLELIQSLLEHWEMPSFSEFTKFARNGFLEDERKRDKKFGQFASKITAAAMHGSTLAKSVCDRAVHQISVGIQMLAANFSDDTVHVSFMGSVINSPYFYKTLSEQLVLGNHKRLILAKPQFSPVTGAVLYAIKRLNKEIHDDVIHNLLKDSRSQP